MNHLNELKNLGLHDSKIYKYIFDISMKTINLFLSIKIAEVDKSNSGYLFPSQKGKLTFEGIESCNADSAFDFKNDNVILEGEVETSGCNLYLSSDQNLIIKCKKVIFEWIL